jgi:cell division septation protein DedD
MEKNAAVNSRPRRTGGLVLNPVQVGLATGFVAVALLVVFGLGVIIGMWYQASGRTSTSADLTSAVGDRAAPGPTTDTHDPEVTFYSTLTTNESSPAALLPLPPPVTGASQQVPADSPDRSGPTPARPTPSQPAVDGSPPLAQPSTHTAAVPPSRTTGTFYSVQVGSFRAAEQAEALRQHLAQKGYDVRVRLSMVPGRGAWYRVRVGSFSNRAAAEDMARRLSSQERRSVMVAEESP